MKFPAVFYDAGEGQSVALDRMSPALILGFACYWAWNYSLLSQTNIFSYNSAMPSAYTDSVAATLASHLFSLLIYGVFYEQAHDFFEGAERRRHNRLVGCVIATCGTCFTALCTLLPGSPTFILVLSGCLTGFGAAILLISFGVSFSVCDLPVIALASGISIMLGILIFLGLAYLVEVEARLGAICCCGLPSLALIGLNISSAKVVDHLSFASFTTHAQVRPFLGHICIPAFFVGMLGALLRDCAIDALQTNSLTNGYGLAIALAALACCALITLAVLSGHYSTQFPFRVVIPVLPLALAYVLVLPNGASPATTGIFIGCSITMEISLWIMLAYIAEAYRIGSFTMFGFGWAARGFGAFTALVFTHQGSEAMQAYGTNEHAICIAALVLLVVLPHFLPTVSEMRRMPAETMEHHETFLTEREFAAVAELRKEELTEEENEPPAPNQPAEPPAPAEPGTPDPHEHFNRQCGQVANTYLLTTRETEVLLLLARGHSAGSIRERLYISEGTVNTHMRNIYRKLNVHSQQELIDLVESASATTRQPEFF